MAVFIAPVAIAKDMTPIAKLERGMTTTIKGELTRILDEDEFRLADQTGSRRAYIGWKNRVLIPIGETITVHGFVDEDLMLYFRPEFYAFDIKSEDGTMVKLHQS